MGEAEDACRYAAERHRTKAVVPAHVQYANVAVSQIILQLLIQFGMDYGPHDVYYLPARKVVRVGEHRHSRRLLVTATVLLPESVHLRVAFKSQLDPREGVYAVVYACMAGLEASQHPGVRRVHDHVAFQGGYVPLPDRDGVRMVVIRSQRIPDSLDVLLADNPSLGIPGPEISVLDPQQVRGYGHWCPDVHQGSHQHPLLLRIGRHPLYRVRGIRNQGSQQLVEILFRITHLISPSWSCNSFPRIPSNPGSVSGCFPAL